MSRHDSSAQEPDPGRLFRKLRDRPVPELDAEALWRRLSRDVAATPPGSRADGVPAPFWFRGPVANLAAAALVLLVVGGGLLIAPLELTPEPGVTWLTPADGAMGGAAAPEVVTDPEAADRTPARDASVRLRVRLLKGFSGRSPAGAMGMEAPGAGGASAVADVRGRLAPVLSHDDYALLDRWQGDLAEGEKTPEAGRRRSVRIELGDYTLSFVVRGISTPGGRARLHVEEVRLLGSSRPLIASSMAIREGDLYLLGLREAGADEAGEPSLILALEASATAGADPGDAGADPDDAGPDPDDAGSEGS